MDSRATHLVTHLLQAVGRGDEGAGERLMEAVYDELRRMAAEQMAREGGPRTLQPTALVHEAYLRLVAGGDGAFENRRHFFSASATAMQRVLVDYARRRGTLKRGGAVASPSDPSQASNGLAQPPHECDGSDRGRDGSVQQTRPAARRAEAVEEIAAFDRDPAEVLDLSEALGKLEELHPELAEVVRLRYFVGLGVEEAADVLGVAPRTVANRWQVARAWLYDALGADEE